MDLPPVEQLLASAAHFLIQGQEHEEAMLLLLCTAEIEHSQWDNFEVHLTGPRATYEAITNDSTSVRDTLMRAFNAVMPGSYGVSSIIVHAQLVDTSNADWRTELMEQAHGRAIHNQGNELPNRRVVLWKSLRFRSEAERRIAIALDTTGVLFLPNCKARLNIGADRDTREPDFLVCREGKWGILEVDGPFHTARAALDHERDRLFQDYRIRVIQRFPSEECMRNAPGVVRRFLTLLEKNG